MDHSYDHGFCYSLAWPTATFKVVYLSATNLAETYRRLLEFTNLFSSIISSALDELSAGVVQHQPVAPPGVNPYAPPQAPGVAVHPTYAPYVAAPPHYGQPPIAPIQSYAAPQPPPPQHTVAVVPSQQIQTYSNPAVEESPESVRPPGQASEDPAPGQEQGKYVRARGFIT